MATAEKAILPAESTGPTLPRDRWMAIRGSICGQLAYLPEHPSGPEVIQSWCGKETTETEWHGDQRTSAFHLR